MNGNTAHLIFEDMRAGKKTLLKCFVDYPDYYQKYDTLLSILTRIDTLFSTPGEKTEEGKEETAQAMESFGRFFPKHFYRDMTIKMNVLVITGYRQIGEDGDYFKYLKLEQAIERAHHELKELGKQFECVKNKPEKYFLMIKSYKNRQKVDQDITKTRPSSLRKIVILTNLCMK